MREARDGNDKEPSREEDEDEEGASKKKTRTHEQAE